MNNTVRRMRYLALTSALLAAGASPASEIKPALPDSLRIATYNVSLQSDDAGRVIAQLRAGHPPARDVAAVIQRVRPDILLLNEFDYDRDGVAAKLFVDRYLGVGQHGEQAIAYPHRYATTVNTGLSSGIDIDADGTINGPQDSWGFGKHPGQFGMLVLSRHPIDKEHARTFQTLLWSALPNPRVPTDPATSAAWYPTPTWSKLRLSSKSHWDLPIDTPLGRLHFLVAHPTPPVFDGPEDRNGARNHDEIGLWARYVGFGNKDWLCDDAGVCGGLPNDARFVIAGDYNADPVDGDSTRHAIRQLLDHPRVLRYVAPSSDGGEWSAKRLRAANTKQAGRPANDTSQFGPKTGNLRLDYVLPSIDFAVSDSGVFWPSPQRPEAAWVEASDHRLVWVDLQLNDRP